MEGGRATQTTSLFHFLLFAGQFKIFHRYVPALG